MEDARSILTGAMLDARRRFGEQLHPRKGFSYEAIYTDESKHRARFADLHGRFFDTLTEGHLRFRPGKHTAPIEGAPALDVASQAAYLLYSIERASLLDAAEAVGRAAGPREVATAYRQAMRSSNHSQGIMDIAVKAHEDLPTAMITGLRRGSSYLGYLQYMKKVRDLTEMHRKLE